MAGGNGNAIIAFLPVKNDVPAQITVKFCRKIGVLSFGFLYQQHIDAACFQVVQNMILARLGRIDIPAGDTHHRSDRKGRAAAA